MQATRERKIEFIKSFGHRALENAIKLAVARIGAENFLTDDQLDEIVSNEVCQVRRLNQNKIRNRRIR